MGGHNSKAEQLQYDSNDWEEVEKSTIYEVMRSKRGQQANLYHFTIKSHRELDEEVDLYHKRRSAANWVQIVGANLTSGGFGFCGSQQSAVVLTQRIPLLLNSITRLNKQQSLVVLYNALRGYNDISRIIVPASLTDKMIGFTREGQTKVWINQNFGMNYPNHIVQDAKLEEGTVISNLLNAIAPKAEIAPEILNELKACRSFNTALGFIRSRGGVPENVLQANRINVASYLGQNQVQVLKDTTPVVQVPVQVPSQGVSPTYQYQPSQVVTGYQSYIPPVSTISQGGYRTPSVQFTHTPGSNNFVNSSTYQPTSIGYQPIRV